MIDSLNPDIMRNNIRKTKAEMGANTEAVDELNTLMGATPLETGKTVTSELADHESRIDTLESTPPPTGSKIKYLDFTRSFTNGVYNLPFDSIPNGYKIINVTPIDDNTNLNFTFSGKVKQSGNDVFIIKVYDTQDMTRVLSSFSTEFRVYFAEVEEYVSE